MSKAKNKCGECGYFRAGYCRNPLSLSVDAYVGKAGVVCERFWKVGEKTPRTKQESRA